MGNKEEEELGKRRRRRRLRRSERKWRRRKRRRRRRRERRRERKRRRKRRRRRMLTHHRPLALFLNHFFSFLIFSRIEEEEDEAKERRGEKGERSFWCLSRFLLYSFGIIDKIWGLLTASPTTLCNRAIQFERDTIRTFWKSVYFWYFAVLILQVSEPLNDFLEWYFLTDLLPIYKGRPRQNTNGSSSPSKEGPLWKQLSSVFVFISFLFKTLFIIWSIGLFDGKAPFK